MPPEKRINKKRFYCRQQALGVDRAQNFMSNLQGIFVTSSVSDKHAIASQAYRMLKQYTEAIPNALEQSEYKFEKLIPGAKGTLFVYWPKIEGYDSPQAAYAKLMQKRREGYSFEAVSRIFPINCTSRTDAREMELAITSVIEMLGGECFICEVKVRNNDGLTASEVRELVKYLSRGKLVEDEQDCYKIVCIQVCQCNCMVGWYTRSDAGEQEG